MEFRMSDFDPFSEEALVDPFGFRRTTAQTRALDWLEKYNIWCAARYDDIRSILLDHGNFSSAGRAGLANYFKQKPWRRPSILLETDPPLHESARRVVARTMSPGAMKKRANSADEHRTKSVFLRTDLGLREVFPRMVDAKRGLS
jgi:4-methoxybenzoate monooxygenase (O-demethylating)